MSPLNDCSLDARAAAAEREVEALAAARAGLPLGQLNREIGGEVALERAHEHRRVRGAAQPDANVAAVRRQPIRSAVAHRPVEGDVAVHRRDFEARGLRVLDDDVAVGRLGGDVAGDVR